MNRLTVDQQRNSFMYRHCMAENCSNITDKDLTIIKNRGCEVLRQMGISNPIGFSDAIDKLDFLEMLENELGFGHATQIYPFQDVNKICNFFEKLAKLEPIINRLKGQVVKSLSELFEFKVYESAYVKNTLAFYPFNNNPYGYCLMLNQIFDREDSDKDSVKMKIAFEDHLKFGFRELNNIGAKEACDVIQQTVADIDCNKIRCDCLVVIVCSHGDQEGLIFGSDKIKRKEIVDNFDKCEKLKGKPKIFIFQNCRIKTDEKVTPNSDTITSGATGNNYEMETDSKFFGTTEKQEFDLPDDVVCAFATQDFKVAYRTKEGTIFVQSLGDLLCNRYFSSESCHELFKELKRQVEEKSQRFKDDDKTLSVQIPEIFHTLKKDFCFHP